MTVAIIDCGGANLRSVQKAVELRSMKTIITNNKYVVSNASFVILPGVGSASSVMNSLKSNSLIPTIKNLTQPVLGICIGMHVLFDHSEEHDTECMGIIAGNIKKFKPDINIKVHRWDGIKLPLMIVMKTNLMTTTILLTVITLQFLIML